MQEKSGTEGAGTLSSSPSSGLSSAKEQGSKPDRILALDYLRFFAAAAVVLYHYSVRASHYLGEGYASSTIGSFARYGHLGVELFFIISGFVITMSAQGRSWKQFLRARIVRLVPMFLVCGLLTYGVMIFAPIEKLKVSLGSLIAHLLLIPLTPIQSVLNTRDLLPPIDGAYWSLTVEGTFYVLVAVVIALGLLRSMRALLWGWMAISFVSLFLNGAPKALTSILFISNYAGWFVCGALFYLWHKEGSLKLADGAALAAALALSVWTTLLKIGRMNLDSTPLEWQNPTVAAVILVVMTIPFFLISSGQLRLPEKLSWAALGASTYPLYLLHQDIGYALLPAVSSFAGYDGAVLLLGAVMTLAAFGLVLWVEKPVGGWVSQAAKFVLRDPPKAPEAAKPS